MSPSTNYNECRRAAFWLTTISVLLGSCNGQDSAGSTPQPVCGDGQWTPGEICEMGEERMCQAEGPYRGGLQSCFADCSGWDDCVANQFCGDGVVNGPEVCEEEAGRDCIDTAGFLGRQSCQDCQWLDCVSQCGDGIVQPPEMCDDPRDFRACGKNCQIVDFPFQIDTACENLVNPEGEMDCLDDAVFIPPEPGPEMTISGTIIDFQAETPVAGAIVSIPRLQREALSDPSGRFELEGIPAGSVYDFRTTATGYHDTWTFDFSVGESDEIGDVNLVAESTYRLVAGLWGRTNNPATCMILGAVTDCSGNPLKGYGVRLLTSSQPKLDSSIQWFRSGFPNGAVCPASEDGLFGIVNMPPPLGAVQIMGSGGTVLDESSIVYCEAKSVGFVNIRLR